MLGKINNIIKGALAAVFCLGASVFCGAATGDLIQVSSEGAVTVDATATAVKIVTVVGAIVMAGVIVWLIIPIIKWIRKVLF
jgi:hypothetical protein